MRLTRVEDYVEQADALLKEGVAAALDAPGLEAADIMLMAIAPLTGGESNLLRTVRRGGEGEAVTRLCVTAAMAVLVDPTMAPATAPGLLARWDFPR